MTEGRLSPIALRALRHLLRGADDTKSIAKALNEVRRDVFTNLNWLSVTEPRLVIGERGVWRLTSEGRRSALRAARVPQLIALCAVVEVAEVGLSATDSDIRRALDRAGLPSDEWALDALFEDLTSTHHVARPAGVDVSPKRVRYWRPLAQGTWAEIERLKNEGGE